MSYIHGKQADIDRLFQAIKSGRGGGYLAKLDKLYGKQNSNFASANEQSIYDFDCPYASTLTARYYKGLSSHGDNLVVEIRRLDET